MQDERTRLLLQQEVLQAELQVAVDSYRPRAIIGTGGTSEDWAEEGPQGAGYLGKTKTGMLPGII